MKRTSALFLALWCAAAVFAEDPVAMPRFEIPSARSASFGGSHVAYTDNVFALLVNPAAIMRVRERSVFALSFTLFSPQKLIDLAGKVSDGMDMGGALEALNNPNNPGKIPLGLAVNELPLSIAYVADGFGFGVWDRVFVNANVIGTNVEATVLADVIIPVGFAFKILDTDAHDVDAGVTVKVFGRGYGDKMVNATQVISDVSGLLDDLGAPVLMGGGVDLGFLYRWDIGLSAGITFDDIFTHGVEIARIGGGDKQNDYYVPFSLNLGVAYDLNIGKYWKTAPSFIANSGVAFAFDWRNFDLLFETKNPYLKKNPVLGIGLGLQFSFIDIIKLRLGLNEMLPAFGFGFDLGVFEIDLSYYGKEFGLEPGQMPSAALDLTFAIRPGAKAKTWPWTKGSLVDLITNLAKKSSQKDNAVSGETSVTNAVDQAVPEGGAAAEPAAIPEGEVTPEETAANNAEQ